LPTLKAIIFDLDDTLYPETSFVTSGFVAVAKWAEQELGEDFRTVLSSLKRLQQEGNQGKVFDVWLAQQGRDGKLAEDMVRAYRRHVPTIRLHVGAKEVLATIKSKLSIGLVSDGYLETQRNKFCALQLEPLFDAVVFSDQLGRSQWKPHPAPFETVLRQLGVAARHAIYVGDNPAKDFIGARRAGLYSVRLRYPDGVYSAMEPKSSEFAPDDHLGDLRELPDWLDRTYPEWR